MVSSTTTARQQSNGGNTLLVSSPVILSPSTSQFTSSVNTSSGLPSSSSQLIAAQNSLAHQQQLQQQSILQVIPQQQRPFHLYQHPHQMFLPGQNQIISQKSGISNGNISNPVIKSATMVPSQQFSQSNQQTVVISQLPHLLQNSQQSIITSNKNVLEPQKGKQFMLQHAGTTIQPKSQILHNTSISSQSLIGQQQFKSSIQSNPQLLTSQSPLLNHPTQLLGPIQQIPHHLTWNHNQGPTLMQHNSQIFLRPPQNVNDGQSLFIHATNPSIQTIPDTPIYVHPSTGAMQLVQATNTSSINTLHHTLINKSLPSNIITSTSSASSTPKINFNHNQISTTKLKNIKLAVSTGSLNNASNTIKPKKIVAVKTPENKQQQLVNKNKICLQKTTQQMNAELLLNNSSNSQNNTTKSKNILVRSESMKNISGGINSTNQKINKSLEKLDSTKTVSKKSDKKDDVKKDKSEKKKHLQKNIAKSQVLTHCIDGHIIQESLYPFQVTNSNSSEKYLKDSSNNEINGISDNLANTDLKEGVKIPALKEHKVKLKKHSKSTKQKLNNSTTNVEVKPIRETKEIVENIEPKIENNEEKPSKSVYEWSIDEVYEFVEKYTSTEFASVFKKQKIDGQALLLLNVAILREDLKLKLGPILTINEKIKELKKDSTYLNEYLPPGGSNIYKWTVEDVYDFVLHMSSKEYAEEFERQEMDGHALTLLSQENLIKDMKILFGPGLKILSRINELKKKSEKN